MKNKKPETIADLQINWKFEKDLYEYDIGTGPQFDKFCQMNPDIWKLKIKPNNYEFKLNNEILRFHLQEGFKNLGAFIHWLNFLVYERTRKEFELSHFEKLSETIYIIHKK